MNERIKELWENSDEIQVVYPRQGSPIYASPELLEKFAELIVKECAQKGFNVFDEEPDAPASDLQYYVRDGIKEHFGVEE